MKKLLIVTNSLSIGGITTSLINILRQIQNLGYYTDLLVFDDSKKLDIKNVKYIQYNKILKIMSMSSSQAREKGICIYIVRSILAILCRILSANVVYGVVFKFCRRLKNYDIAISFSNNLNCRSLYFGANKFVLEKVDAKKKITWLHVDYEKMNIDSYITKKEYRKFDRIVAVSEATKESFLKYNYELKDKCIVVYNCLDWKTIQVQSNEKNNIMVENSIVCVGRLDKNKSQITLIKLANDLKLRGIKFKIYLIGDGPEKENIQNEIERLNLKDCVEILGWINNPYPYIKKAKMLISVSLTESFGFSIAEALLLNTPVVSLSYPAITELIENNVNGNVCYDYQELLESVVKMLTCKEYYLKLKKNTKLFITADLVKEQLRKTFGD